MFFNVVFAGMIAFNFYEPLADLVDKTGIGWGFSECLCLMLLFGVSIVALRLTTETLGPAMVRFPMPIYHAGRLIFGLAGACVTMAIILLAFETAPVHKKLFKAYNYDSKPPFGAGFDHQWLGFFQHETGFVFAQYNAGRPDPFGTYGQGHPHQPLRPQGRVADQPPELAGRTAPRASRRKRPRPPQRAPPKPVAASRLAVAVGAAVVEIAGSTTSARRHPESRRRPVLAVLPGSIPPLGQVALHLDQLELG